MWRCAVVLVVAVGLAVGVTMPKLHKMAQIKGWRPGATVTTKSVTQKGVDKGGRGREFYWVSWANSGESISRADRDELSPEIWKNVRVGDSVEVVRVPGDDSAYLKNGVFVEPGNFVFDYVLLAGEVITALVMAVVLFRARRGRAPELTPDLVREKLTSTLRVIDESLPGHRKELEQLEEQAGNEPSPELKAKYLKQADEKREAIEQIVCLRQSIENQLNDLQSL